MKLRSGIRWLAFGAGVAAGAYATYAGAAWLRYGRSRPAKPEEADDLLDAFMPEYEIAERHNISVDAPADITFSTACAMDLQDSGLIRAIFKTRELLLLGKTRESRLPRGLLSQTKALGWAVLAETPGREIVMGSVTQPWKGTPQFKGLDPDEFAAFHEPGYVKIVWTLRADAVSPMESVFRTETRATCTDAEARAKFRLYWSLLSPGIILIRSLSLGPLKKASEYRARKRRLEQRVPLPL